MSARFDVAVKDSVTYYWKLAYNPIFETFFPVALVSAERAVNGGPTYGVDLRSEFQAYDPSGLGTQLGGARSNSMLAAYTGMGAGCPGTGYMKTVFRNRGGTDGYYKIFSGRRLIMEGFIRSGALSDNDQPDLPPGGNPDACVDDDDGITGGNT